MSLFALKKSNLLIIWFNNNNHDIKLEIKLDEIYSDYTVRRLININNVIKKRMKLYKLSLDDFFNWKHLYFSYTQKFSNVLKSIRHEIEKTCEGYLMSTVTKLNLDEETEKKMLNETIIMFNHAFKKHALILSNIKMLSKIYKVKNWNADVYGIICSFLFEVI